MPSFVARLHSRNGLVRDSHGAAAIEYAVIGALIGIGLVGALIGTKTSLSNVFNRGASAMASAQGGTASSLPSLASKSVFAAKTITVRSSQQYNMSSPGNGSENDFLTFSDGSSAYRTMHFNVDGTDAGYYEYYMTDKASGLYYRFSVDNSGATTYMYKTATPAVDGFNGYKYYYMPDKTMSVSNSDNRTFTTQSVSSDMLALTANSPADRDFMNYQIGR